MSNRGMRFIAYGSVTLLALATLTATAATASANSVTRGPDLCGPGTAITLDRSEFSSDPEIRNKWFPLEPGMQFTTKGKVVNTVEKTTSKRTVISTVTGLTKKVDGVNTLVVWDRDFTDGELAESELAFFAETKKGTVWLFGEYPEEYEGGKLAGAPSTFISGIDNAQAGIAMLDHPRPKEPAYPQAYAPSVDFLDCAKVVNRHEKVCVPTGCYHNSLVIEESNPLEPRSVAGLQRKFYDNKTGLVQVRPVGGEDQESLDLVGIKKLSDSELKSINAQALAQDSRGYTVSKDVYAKTPRAVVAKPRRW